MDSGSASTHHDCVRQLPRGIVTLLFTDIAGSTRLLLEHGPAYVEMLAEHRRLLRVAFRRHGGVEVDTQGDSFFVAFERADAALAAAGDAQEALRDGPVQVRIGIHTGEPIVWAEGYAGVDVHRGARIAAAAHPAQVLVSEATHRAASAPPSLRDLGLHRLKDLSEAQRLYQLGSGDFPPLRTLHATNLPVASSPLIGRRRELEAVAELVRSHRVVTITGTGGSGKTSLALQAAAELVDDHRDGVFWVPLAGLTAAALVPTTIARAIGAQDDLATFLAGRHALLLLDNFEHVIDAAGPLGEVLRTAPDVRVLVTSRAPLRIAGEMEYPLDTLRPDDAVTLFVERARAAGRHLEPDQTVREICRRLDHLPLAIELAAARTRLLAPGALLPRLERGLAILSAGRRDAPARHRTLRATIEWSYDLLDGDARACFAQLGVFAGSFSFQAAERVAAADVDVLNGLVEASLVQALDDGRFRMLETVRDYALERLGGSDVAEEVRRRHASWLLSLAMSANLVEDAPGRAHPEWIVPDHDNVRAALAWALDAGAIELGLRLAAALEAYWTVRDPAEGVLWLERFLGLASESPPGVRGLAFRAYGGAANFADYDVAERAYEHSLEAFREAGDERGIASLMHRLGSLALYRGELVRARTLVEESLRGHRQSENRKGEAQVLGTLGQIERADGNERAGIELIERSAAQSAACGFEWWQGRMLRTLCEAALARGALVEAGARGREALRLFAAMGDHVSTRYALALLAVTMTEQGQPELAGTLWGAVERAEEQGPLKAWHVERAACAARLEAAADAAFRNAVTVGRTRTLDAAVAIALGGTASR